MHLRRRFALVLLLTALAGCTGEGARVVLPAHHPANPAAAEAPFALPVDPFATLTSPPAPSRPEAPPGKEHEGHPSPTGGQARPDGETGSQMIHHGHDGPNAAGRQAKP